MRTFAIEVSQWSKYGLLHKLEGLKAKPRRWMATERQLLVWLNVSTTTCGGVSTELILTTWPSWPSRPRDTGHLEWKRAKIQDDVEASSVVLLFAST